MQVKNTISTGFSGKQIDFTLQELLILKDAAHLLQLLRSDEVTFTPQKRKSLDSDITRDQLEIAKDAAYNVGILLETITSNVITLDEVAKNMFDPDFANKHKIPVNQKP